MKFHYRSIRWAISISLTTWICFAEGSKCNKCHSQSQVNRQLSRPASIKTSNTDGSNAGGELDGKNPPKPRGKLESDQGINEKIYDGFVFNELFYNLSVASSEKGSLETYLEYFYELETLMRKANTSALTVPEYSKWNLVADALAESFRRERGVVVYSAEEFSPGWYFCGWVELNSTFVSAGGLFRMCATLQSIGMDDITRDPVPMFDYGEPTLTSALFRRGKYSQLWSHVNAHQVHSGIAQWKKPTHTAMSLKGVDSKGANFSPVPRLEEVAQSVKQRASGRSTLVNLFAEEASCKLSHSLLLLLSSLLMIF